MDIRVKGGELSKEEIDVYVNHIKSKLKHRTLTSLEITVDGEFVELKWETAPQKFDRIRRVTGYLSGTVDTWNNAKQSEERDRVKHI